MTHFWTKFVVAFTLILLSAACETAPPVVEPISTSFFAVEPTTIIIKGKKLNNVLEDGTELNEALKALGTVTLVSGPKGELKRRIMALRKADKEGASDLPGLSGINGIFGREILDAADQALGSGGNFNNATKVVTEVSGQINQYYFNPDDGSGFLGVDTFVTKKKFNKNNPTNPIKVSTDAYRWSVAITAGTYTVKTKNTSADPFPGTIPFSPTQIAEINSKGFDRKLWAKGTGIVVISVEFDKNYDPTSPNFVLLDPTKNKNKNLYKTDADSCIDMLFVGDPPRLYSQLMGPPTYCLGRCAQPLLVNTGF